MKHRVTLIAILLASPALLAAQSPQPAPGGSGAINSITVTMTSPEGSKTVTVPVSTLRTCPISIEAKQGSGAGLVAVRKQDRPPDNEPSILSNKPGQHIHLILGRVSGVEFSDLEQIVSATVTARGLSANGHFSATPATIGGTSSDLRRTLDVRFTAENDGTIYADLDLPGFTSVQSIRIDSIALKDGSKWTFDTKQACVVTPDPLMLIAIQ